MAHFGPYCQLPLPRDSRLELTQRRLVFDCPAPLTLRGGKVAANAGHSRRRVTSEAAGVSTRWCEHLRAIPIWWWVSGGCVGVTVPAGVVVERCALPSVTLAHLESLCTCR